MCPTNLYIRHFIRLWLERVSVKILRKRPFLRKANFVDFRPFPGLSIRWMMGPENFLRRSIEETVGYQMSIRFSIFEHQQGLFWPSQGDPSTLWKVTFSLFSQFSPAARSQREKITSDSCSASKIGLGIPFLKLFPCSVVEKTLGEEKVTMVIWTHWEKPV